MSVLLVQGDALKLPLRDTSVQCVVTSVPYLWQRDYGTSTWEGGSATCSHSPADTPGKRGLASSTLGGNHKTTGHQREGYGGQCHCCGARRVDAQLGREATPAEWVANMVTVFREVKRCLREDGTLWLNVGDKMVDKQLLGMPWKLAFALQDDGWLLRSAITWCKKSPMPESVADRPTSATEMVFLFAKSPRYFYDAVAVREDGRNGWHGSSFTSAQDKATKPGLGQQERCERPGRNLWNYWVLGPEPLAMAHYASFPQALVSRCVRAGSPLQCCAQCRRPYERVVERTTCEPSYRRGNTPEVAHAYHGTSSTRTLGMVQHVSTQGFRPACPCITQALAGGCRDPQQMDWLTTPVPSIVLDPFSGAATVPLTARQLGRHGIGIDLSWPYLQLSRERLSLTALDAWNGKAPTPAPAETFHDLPMFANNASHTHQNPFPFNGGNNA